MTTTARRCAGCAGPLPELPEGESQLKCGFCGLVNEVTLEDPTLVIRMMTAPARRSGVGKIVAIFTAVVLAIGVVGAIVGVIVAVRSVMFVNETVQQVTGGVSQAVAAVDERSRPIPPSALRTLVNSGWRTLDVPAPPSGWKAFDPVASLAWAERIGTEWQPDAQLMRIDVEKLSAAGAIDATGPDDSYGGYRFSSPSQQAAWMRAAAAGDRDPVVGHELIVRVVSGKVTAVVTGGRPWPQHMPRTAAASLPVREVLQHLHAQRGVEPAQFYDGYMICDERQGWVWYFTPLGQQSSLPWIRARDGAVHH